MPSLQQTELPIAALTLDPSARQSLTASLSTYATLKADFDLLQEQINQERDTIGAILDAAGVDKARTDEFTLAWVRGSTSSSLDKKKLIANGVSMAQIEAATVIKPRKSYFVIKGIAERRSNGDDQ